MIAEAVAGNQLFFSIACVMNYQPCIAAMKWFRGHPLLVGFTQIPEPEANPGHAQLIFTTHDTELLNMEIIRKDQVYFLDKDRHSGVSELFNLTEFQVRTNDNI
ncbi:MAG: AAA family ATPase [Eisenbergiella massiliensis]